MAALTITKQEIKMLSSQEKDGVLEIVFEGRLDTTTCTEMEKDVAEKISASKLPIVFNLAGTSFISSSFLRICICSSRNAQNRNFKIREAMPHIRKVFKISGLDSFLES
jgi:anti-anti-sigma factor